MYWDSERAGLVHPENGNLREHLTAQQAVEGIERWSRTAKGWQVTGKACKKEIAISEEKTVSQCGYLRLDQVYRAGCEICSWRYSGPSKALSNLVQGGCALDEGCPEELLRSLLVWCEAGRLSDLGL